MIYDYLTYLKHTSDSSANSNKSDPKDKSSSPGKALSRCPPTAVKRLIDSPMPNRVGQGIALREDTHVESSRLLAFPAHLQTKVPTIGTWVTYLCALALMHFGC